MSELTRKVGGGWSRLPGAKRRLREAEEVGQEWMRTLERRRSLRLKHWFGCDLTEMEAAIIELQADIERIDRIIKRLGGPDE